MAVTKARTSAGANERAVAKMKASMGKASGSSSDEDADEDEDDDDDDGGSGGDIEVAAPEEPAEEIEVGGEPEPTPRQRRRQERMSMREENEHLRARDAQRDRELAELRGMVQARQQEPARQAQQEADPDEVNLRATRLERQQLVTRWQSMTPEERQREHAALYEKDTTLKDQEEDLAFKIRQKKYGGGGVSREEAALAARNELLQSQYPDVATHPKAWAWACGIQNAEIATAALDYGGDAKRVPQNVVDGITHRVLQGARLRFGLGQGQGPAPTQSQRSRYSGSATSPGAAARLSAKAPATLKVSRSSSEGKMFMKMAIATFPHIARKSGNDAALKHWLKVAGPGVAREHSKKA